MLSLKNWIQCKILITFSSMNPHHYICRTLFLIITRFVSSRSWLPEIGCRPKQQIRWLSSDGRFCVLLQNLWKFWRNLDWMIGVHWRAEWGHRLKAKKRVKIIDHLSIQNILFCCACISYLKITCLWLKDLKNTSLLLWKTGIQMKYD